MKPYIFDDWIEWGINGDRWFAVDKGGRWWLRKRWNAYQWPVDGNWLL